MSGGGRARAAIHQFSPFRGPALRSIAVRPDTPQFAVIFGERFIKAMAA
jgi:hypothetical protein